MAATNTHIPTLRLSVWPIRAAQLPESPDLFLTPALFGSQAKQQTFVIDTPASIAERIRATINSAAEHDVPTRAEVRHTARACARTQIPTLPTAPRLMGNSTDLIISLKEIIYSRDRSLTHLRRVDVRISDRAAPCFSGASTHALCLAIPLRTTMSPRKHLTLVRRYRTHTVTG